MFGPALAAQPRGPLDKICSGHGSVGRPPGLDGVLQQNNTTDSTLRHPLAQVGFGTSKALQNKDLRQTTRARLVHLMSALSLHAPKETQRGDVAIIQGLPNQY